MSRPVDAELRALRRIDTLMKGLDEPAQERVATWTYDRFVASRALGRVERPAEAAGRVGDECRDGAR